MIVLVYSLLIFISALMLHFFIWQIRVPNNQVKALLKIFLLTLLIYSLILLFIPKNFKLIGLRESVTIFEYLRIIFLYFSLVASYIATYPAIEVDSPTLSIIIAIANARSKGLGKDQLRQAMNNEFLIKPRVNDLLNAKMITLYKDKYKITRRGILFYRPFMFYRKLLNIGKGG